MPATAPRSLHRVPLDREAHTLTWRLTVGDLTGAETEAHLHGPAAAGQSAPVLVDLGLGVTKGGVWSFPAGLEQALVSHAEGSAGGGRARSSPPGKASVCTSTGVGLSHALQLELRP